MPSGGAPKPGLMELDIAVEAVLTGNAAVHGVISRLVPRCDAILGHSTGEHSAAMAAGALDVETDERLAAFCHGLYASYADAAERHEVPAAVLLAIGADAEDARRIAEEAGGELYLAMDNCPHQAVLVGEAEAAARAQRDRGWRGADVRGAAIRPRRAHATVRALRRGSTCDLRGTASPHRDDAAVVVHHRGSLP